MIKKMFKWQSDRYNSVQMLSILLTHWKYESLPNFSRNSGKWRSGFDERKLSGSIRQRTHQTLPLEQTRSQHSVQIWSSGQERRRDRRPIQCGRVDPSCHHCWRYRVFGQNINSDSVGFCHFIQRNWEALFFDAPLSHKRCWTCPDLCLCPTLLPPHLS